MAIYFCRVSHGKVGKAIPHYDYIHGLNKYAYKQKEIAYVTENMPKWANGRDFFQMSDDFERANGVAYKELKLALPHEFSLEDNKKLLHDFIQKELGDKYYYSAVIHEKEIENKVEQNIHVHLMFCTRELDGIERSGRNFFKQAFSRAPEKGGCPKNPKWDSNDIKSLKEIRKSWEKTLNQHLQEHGIEKVSSLSLKEQYQEALKSGDKVKARLFKRKAINIQMRILKKALAGEKLTRWEEKQYKKYLKNKAVKVSLEKDYKDTIALQKQLAKNKDKIKKIQEKIIPVHEFEPPKYSSLIDVEKKILILEKELELLRNANSFSAIKISAINNINPNYEKLNLELNYYLQKLNTFENSDVDDMLREEYTYKIATLREQIETIDKTISLDILEDLIVKEKIILNEKLEQLEKDKETLMKQREYIYREPNTEAYVLDKVSAYTKFAQTIEVLTDLEYELKNINRDLTQLEKKLDPKNISETAKDILSKGKYKKTKSDIDRTTDKINAIVREIKGGFYDNRPDLLEAKKEEYKILKERLNKLQSKEFNFDKTSKVLENIETSLKSKLETRQEKLFNKKFILEQEIEFYKLGLLQEKNVDDIFINKEQLYSEKINNAMYSETKYKTARENIESIFSSSNIQKLAYNKITKGQYNKMLKEYDKLEKEIKKLSDEKNNTNKLTLKYFNLKSQISKLEGEKLELQKRYHNMINAISPELLRETIKELEYTKKQTLKNLKTKENEAKENKFKYIHKKARLKEHQKEVKPYTFENYKKATQHLHNLQKCNFKNFYTQEKNNVSHGHSRSLFEDEELTKLSKFYSEHVKDHEDLDIGL